MTTYSDCKLKLLCVVTLSLIQLLDNMHTKPLVLVRSHGPPRRLLLVLTIIAIAS